MRALTTLCFFFAVLRCTIGYDRYRISPVRTRGSVRRSLPSKALSDDDMFAFSMFPIMKKAVTDGASDEIVSRTYSTLEAAHPFVPAKEIDNFPEIVAGSAAGVLVYLWALFEFLNRIRIQRECLVCKGTGLVRIGRDGSPSSRPRKCYACGGFLPWESWGKFWQSNLNVGNGGVLRRPSRDYKKMNDELRENSNK